MEEGNVADIREARTVEGGAPPYTYEHKSAMEIVNIFSSSVESTIWYKPTEISGEIIPK